MAKRGNRSDIISAEDANEDNTPPDAKLPRQINSYADDGICEPQSGTGLRHTQHGNMFQLKLLMLFLLRGIRLKYNIFHLSTEMPGQGGKFDDLIFYYQEAARGDYRYRFLQAKHKQSNKAKITATDLSTKTDGEFSLQKYFRSYRNEIANRGKHVEDCIICTNIGFGDKGIESEDFKLALIDSDDKILSIEQEPNFDKVPARYKLEKTEKLEDLLYECSDLHQLAKELLEHAKSNKKLILSVNIFKKYHIALIKKNVMKKNEEKLTFHDDFINNLKEKPFYKALFKLWSEDDTKNLGQSGFTDYLKVTTFTCSIPFGSEDLAKKLLEHAKTYNSNNKLTLIVDFFKKYHIALVKENVMRKNNEKLTFHDDFINNLKAKPFHRALFKLWSEDNENSGQPEFTAYLQATTFTFSEEPESDRKLDDVVTEDEINDFLNKLVFAVDMPDEVRLGQILTKEVGQHFQLRECDFQSSFILEKMMDWFKKKQGTVMITEFNNKITEGNNLFEQTRLKMLALRATAFSIDFRAKYLPSFFRESFQYQDATILEKAKELENFLNSPKENKIFLISTPSKRLTTIKILSALDTLQRFKNSVDGYLLIESEHLITGHMKEWVQAAMKEEKSHEILIIIGETPVEINNYVKELMPDERLRKKMIFICSADVSETTDLQRDEFDCNLLSEETINEILSTQVTFQGSEITIANLVMERNRLNKILDSSSVEEILFHRRKVIIPSFDSQEFEKSLWIERSLLPAPPILDGSAIKGIDEKYEFKPETNQIEWLIENDDEKSMMWEQVQQLLEKTKSNKTTSHKTSPTIANSLPENILVDQSTAIITGVAGSGKSTILSRHYERVKNDNPNVWVIKINLISHSKYLSELTIPVSKSGEASNTYSAIDFLINFPGVTSNSWFARSLLRNRLKNSGGIVLMLDGFDEINYECQKNTIGLIKALSDGKTKLDRLIITTRPHLTEILQNALFQFAFSLENLRKHHQVEYLTKYWRKKTNVNDEKLIQKFANFNYVNDEELIKGFANHLVERVSDALKDKERTFIGIPLQCRILAECFQSQLNRLDEQDSFTDFTSEIGPNFNVAQLYRMLFMKKSDIFRQEKATGSTDSDLIVNWALNEFLQTLDSYHLKLAIKTIFEEKNVNLLWPPQQLSDRQHNEDKMEEKMRRYALQFGLTSTDTQQPKKLEFLHRTFAEYLVAEFLYKGFLSEENKDKDQIQDSDGPLRDFMIHHILVKNAYEGVRVFLDSMLRDMAVTDKTWRETIPKSINESRPNQLQRFAQHFSFSMFDYLKGGSRAEALLTAISEGNVGIYDLMLDCLGAIYDRKSVQEMVGKAIKNDVFFSFFNCSVEIHQRVVNFLVDAGEDVVNGLLKLMKKQFPFAEAKCYSNFPRKEYLAFTLDFMEKHQKNLKKLFSQAELESYKLLESNGCFILDDCYDQELRRFIKLQITNEYFVDNLNYGGQAMSSQNENWVNGNIEKILTILRDLGQDGILEKMSKTVLTSNPQLWERFYGPCVLDNDRIAELESLALENDKYAVSKLKWQFLAAAVVGDEDVCEKTLQILSIHNENFLRGLSTVWMTYDDLNWLEESGFIYEALINATESRRTDMSTLIIRVVYRHFDLQNNRGKEALRNLLILNCNSGIEYFGKYMLELFEEDTLKAIVQMKFTKEEDGSDLLTKVLLFTKSSAETTNDFEKGFSLMLQLVLSHFNQQQLFKFIRLITSEDHKIEIQGIRHSMWTHTVARVKSEYDSHCDHFLKLIASRLNQEDVKNLLLHQEGNIVVLYKTALMNDDANLVNKLCTRWLSQENRDFISSDFYGKAPNIILNMFRQYSLEMRTYEEKITNLIHFFLDHAIDDQLLQLVDIITSPVEGKGSYWEYLFDHLNDETILKMLRKLNAGNENKNEQVVKKLLTIDDLRGPDAVIIRAAQQKGEDFFETVCATLSEKSQKEIADFFKRHAPQRINEIFFSEEPTFWKCNSETRWNALNFFLIHCNDIQRSELVNVVTAVRCDDEGKGLSIWSSCIAETANTTDDWSPGCPRAQACRKLEIFLENVNRKIGGDSVIKLLLHNDEQNTDIIFIRIVLLYTGTLRNDSSDFTSRFTINNNILSRENQVELGQKLAPVIDQFFKDKTTSCFSQLQWIRALHFNLDYFKDSNLSTKFFDIITNKHDGPNKNKTSIWECIFLNIIPEVVNVLSYLLRHIKEKLGEDIVKMLALEKNEKGRFILGEALRTHAYENNVKNMFTHLSTETRNEVVKILFQDPYLTSRLNVEIGSRSFSDNTSGELLVYFDLVRTTHINVDGKNCSMWTNYVGKIGQTLTIEKFEQFLKFISDQLGEEYLKKLVLHDDGDGQSTISRSISQEENTKVDAMFWLLSPPSQMEVSQKAYTTPGMIEKMLSSKGSDYWSRLYLKIDSTNGTASNLPDGFNVLASYFLEKFNLEQLKQFIKLVTSLNKVDGKTQSIWSDYIEKLCSIRGYTVMDQERKKFSSSSIDRLLDVVSSNLGATTVLELMYHCDSSRVVINYIALSENKEITEIAFRHLEQHERNGKIHLSPIDGRPGKEQPIVREQTKPRGKKQSKKKQKANRSM